MKLSLKCFVLVLLSYFWFPMQIDAINNFGPSVGISDATTQNTILSIWTNKDNHTIETATFNMFSTPPGWNPLRVLSTNTAYSGMVEMDRISGYALAVWVQDNLQPDNKTTVKNVYGQFFVSGTGTNAGWQGEPQLLSQIDQPHDFTIMTHISHTSGDANDVYFVVMWTEKLTTTSDMVVSIATGGFNGTAFFWNASVEGPITGG